MNRRKNCENRSNKKIISRIAKRYNENSYKRTRSCSDPIRSGKTAGIPTRPEILFALSSNIATYALEHHSEEEIRNAVGYVAKLPTEFKNRIFADFLKVKGIHRVLSRIYEYDDWFMRSGRDWEDYGLWWRNKEKTDYNDLDIVEHVKLYADDGMSEKEAIKLVAKERNVAKSVIYNEYHNRKWCYEINSRIRKSG